MSIAVATDTRTKKVSKVVVEQVKELVNIRAEVKTLEGQAKKIVTALEKEFGKNDVAKTSDFDTLVHHNIEVARLDWRERSNFSLDAFKVAFTNLVVTTHPELADSLEVMLAEAVTEAQSLTIYTALTTLYK
jgi:predicted metalloprotease with PDZ domain